MLLHVLLLSIIRSIYLTERHVSFKEHQIEIVRIVRVILGAHI